MSDEQPVQVIGSLLLSFQNACVNLNFYVDDDTQAILETVDPEGWYPVQLFVGLMELVSSRYENPSPIMERIGVEMMRGWYHHGPGKDIVFSGLDFLHFQTSSQGYASVFKGPKSALGEFFLESLDEGQGTATVVSTTPFPTDMERGVLIGGLGLVGDLPFIAVDSTETPERRFDIRFSTKAKPAPTGSDARPIDADTFLGAPEVGASDVLRGDELREAFWRFRAIAHELNRLRSFWESTNKTLSRAFGMLQESREALRKSYAELDAEREKSERLLLNILPQPVAAQLKERPGIIAEERPDVTILFIDTVQFTQMAGRIQARDLISVLNEMFSLFDEVAEQHGVEKLKTIGDCYMAASNLTVTRPDHVEAIAEMALAIRERLHELPKVGGQPVQVRLGFHTGLVVAGVIGASTFSYDVWGDTVNFASRMESSGLPGEIQVSEAVYQRLSDRYLFEPRAVQLKYHGDVQTYILRDRVPAGESDAPRRPAAHS